VKEAVGVASKASTRLPAQLLSQVKRMCNLILARFKLYWKRLLLKHSKTLSWRACEFQVLCQYATADWIYG
jgi:hypothetical protein